MKNKKLIFSLLTILLMSTASFAQNKDQKSKDMLQIKTLQSIHDSTKSLSVNLLFKGKEGTTRSLQINKDGLLPEHTTKTEALLICVSGEVVFENEKNEKYTLKAGDFYHIEPNVKHWVKGIHNSQLLLLK